MEAYSPQPAFLNLERRLRIDPEREITVLLTFESNGKMPPMLDHPTRDLAEWGRAFVRRHCPGENRSFEARTGDPGSAVIDVAEKTNSDLIVLSFKGNFGWGHGWVVREVLARSVVPVFLLPAPFAQLPADVTVTATASADDANTWLSDSQPCADVVVDSGMLPRRRRSSLGLLRLRGSRNDVGISALERRPVSTRTLFRIGMPSGSEGRWNAETRGGMLRGGLGPMPHQTPWVLLVNGGGPSPPKLPRDRLCREVRAGPPQEWGFGPAGLIHSAPAGPCRQTS